jgi:hypothetical protein
MGSVLCHSLGRDVRMRLMAWGHSDPELCCADQERQVWTDQRVPAVLRLEGRQHECTTLLVLRPSSSILVCGLGRRVLPAPASALDDGRFLTNTRSMSPLFFQIPSGTHNL